MFHNNYGIYIGAIESTLILGAYEEAGSLSVLQLIEMYNDAIETIWYLQERLNELSVENDALWDDYEELSNQLYG